VANPAKCALTADGSASHVEQRMGTSARLGVLPQRQGTRSYDPGRSPGAPGLLTNDFHLGRNAILSHWLAITEVTATLCSKRGRVLRWSALNNSRSLKRENLYGVILPHKKARSKKTKANWSTLLEKKTPTVYIFPLKRTLVSF